jgi:hypothetical protein
VRAGLIPDSPATSQNLARVQDSFSIEYELNGAHQGDAGRPRPPFEGCHFFDTDTVLGGEASTDRTQILIDQRRNLLVACGNRCNRRGYPLRTSPADPIRHHSDRLQNRSRSTGSRLVGNSPIGLSSLLVEI